MADTLIAHDTSRRALEERHGLESLEDLQGERDLLLPRYHELKALYGPFGTADARRKKLLEGLKLRCFNPSGRDPRPPEKLTEKLVDAWAHDHPEYAAHLDRMERGRIEFFDLDVQVGKIEERIKNREVLAGLRRGEMHLG